MEIEKRLIYADAALEVLQDLRENDEFPEYRTAIRAVERLPTVDAVEVVRCEDCKFWKPSGSMMGDSFDTMEPIGGCPLARFCRKASDFCSKGERRSDA